MGQETVSRTLRSEEKAPILWEKVWGAENWKGLSHFFFFFSQMAAVPTWSLLWGLLGYKQGIPSFQELVQRDEKRTPLTVTAQLPCSSECSQGSSGCSLVFLPLPTS